MMFGPWSTVCPSAPFQQRYTVGIGNQHRVPEMPTNGKEREGKYPMSDAASDAAQPRRPTSDEDREGWKDYWAKSQPREWLDRWGYWRTEPEIDEQRQRFLAARRAVKPDVELGIYPFHDEHGPITLTRADV